MSFSRPSIEPSRFSSYASASSGTASVASTSPVLSRTASQDSLASDITKYSETSNDAIVDLKIASKTANLSIEEITPITPVQRVCFVGGGYVGKSCQYR